MRLILMTCLTMLAFASNSILNRVALTDGDIDPVSFGVVRLIAGAVMLATLVLLRDRKFALAGDRPGHRGRVARRLYLRIFAGLSKP